MLRLISILSFTMILTFSPSPVRAQGSFDAVMDRVNQRVVKLFGSGGFQGITSYGTGILISPKGHILTTASQFLDTQDLRVHLYDGRLVRARVLIVEPEFDAAILEIKKDSPTDKDLDLPYYDLAKEAKAIRSQPGDWILALSNPFQIANRDESMSIQQGTISAYSKLTARRGITEVPFNGEVFFIGSIINNPGAAGGAVTTKKGDLIGMIGKEYRNTQSDTWSNYAIPLNCKLEIKVGTQTKTATLAEFAEEAIAGKWVSTAKNRSKNKEGPGAYHGIVFVPNVVEKTPPYIDSIIPSSPAAKAGLKVDDLIVYVEGEPVYSIRGFREMIAKTKPGTELKLEVRRGEKLTAVSITLSEFPKK